VQRTVKVDLGTSLQRAVSSPLDGRPIGRVGRNYRAQVAGIVQGLRSPKPVLESGCDKNVARRQSRGRKHGGPIMARKNAETTKHQLIGENLYLKQENGMIWIGIDPASPEFVSKTGKMAMLASSRGFCSITPTGGGATFRVNINAGR
jgi:hypothetical protein